ncbi:sec-independent protein translocase protein TatB [Devosia subaequoris]|uniref:Sec-independent protein translocase protein TatB n=1 Tax=Devosia subaequoris TaxID=395930 RepID=A0A7W6IKH7_9HYPH|nr:twin-arginine translocase TatA/TatE family subunit [Devosia subaequoris]MBB4050691.1 sec-independent protein translocase protein TatB [Devosia subaequoris]MCP1208628.1 twin-arginine translocase TatA/TatE family subunit [Devosia subaequoris]
MLGLGWTEMLVIGVMALIFIGPKDLPVVMGRVGKVIGQVQRMGREFQREINKTTGLDEVRNLRSSITSPLKKTADEIRKDFNSIGKDGKESPSGALKPTDPQEESVVEAIQQQVGMAPAKKSADEMAAEYGFTTKKAEPVKAPARASRAATAKGSTGKTSTPKPAAAKATRARSSAAKSARKPAAKSSVATPAAAEAPTAEASASQLDKPATPRAARGATATAKKPVRKTPAKAADQGDKPAKPRATRKKTAVTAGKTE